MRIQAGIVTPRPPAFHPRQRVGAALKFILVSNKAGHRVLLTVVSLNPSFFAAGAGDGQRRSRGCCSWCSSLGSGYRSWLSVDTASSPKYPHLSGWGGSAALNSVCSNSKHSEAESLKGSAHNTASFLILGVFPPPAIKTSSIIILLGFFSLSADTHFPLSFSPLDVPLPRLGALDCVFTRNLEKEKNSTTAKPPGLNPNFLPSSITG